MGMNFWRMCGDFGEHGGSDSRGDRDDASEDARQQTAQVTESDGAIGSFPTNQESVGASDPGGTTKRINAKPAINVTSHGVLDQQLGEFRRLKLDGMRLIEAAVE